MSGDSSFEARVKVWGFRAYCSEGRDSELNGEPNETLDLKARVKLRHRDIEDMGFVAGLQVEGLQGPKEVSCVAGFREEGSWMLRTLFSG